MKTAEEAIAKSLPRIEENIARIAHALEAIAKKNDPEFQSLLDIRRTAMEAMDSVTPEDIAAGKSF